MEGRLQHVADRKLVVAFTFLVSVIAVYVSYATGVIVAYNDAAAHLNTARRMIDSLTPGIVQIGSVWLPLLHIAELPFAANMFLWKTGLAGAIVSGISFIIATFFLYQLSVYVTGKKLAGVLTVIVFVSNLNLLYLQTTAMFEPMLMATASGAVYYLTKWTKEAQVLHLLLGAFSIMLATLTRYDGWAMFLAASGIVVLISIFRGRNGREGAVLLFLVLAGFGIFLWLLYNQMIFSDPLYFSRSEFSAAAQQNILEERGQLPDKHNLLSSIMTYTLAVVVNNGLIVTGMGISGIVVYLIMWLRKWELWKITPLLLLVPYGFNIVSLYAGQSVIWMPMLPPFFETYFNARYGLLMLPAIAFFSGYLIYLHGFFTLPVLSITAFQVFLFLNPSVLPIMGKEIGIITLQDTVSSVNQQTYQASTFLREHHRGELILISSASADAFIFRVGIPLRYFITEGTGRYWKESLDEPRRYAGYVVFFKDHTDRVGKRMVKISSFPDDFERIYQDQTYEIWKKRRTTE